MARSKRSSTSSARPRFHTPRTVGSVSYGHGVGVIGGALGLPFMPWQVDAAAVIGELNDDRTAMRWPYVVVHVPRRAGKGVTVLSTLTHRLLTARGRRCHYTAQTRDAAAKVWREEWAPRWETSPLWPELHLRRSNGSETLRVRALASTLSLFAPNETAVHGEDTDLPVVDEAWAFDIEQGGKIEAALQPAQLTRPMRQLIIVSAGGTERSTWLARWMDLARAGTPGVALIDYGADDDDDLDDPRVWARVHPAVGHTMTLDGMATMRGTMPAEEFHRAILGVWTKGPQAQAQIDAETWRSRADAAAAPAGRLAYGADVSHDGRTASIAAAATVDGRVVVEVVWTGPTSEAASAWRTIRGRNRGQLYADQLGPAASLVDELARRRLPVNLVTTSQYAAACEAFLRDVRDDGLRHRAQPVLDAAAGMATARAVGDRWVWERRGTDVSAIVAATLAAHGARRPSATPTTVVQAG